MRRYFALFLALLVLLLSVSTVQAGNDSDSYRVVSTLYDEAENSNDVDMTAATEKNTASSSDIFVATYIGTVSENVAYADQTAGKACSLEIMKDKYLAEGSVDTLCWYCKIVIVMTNAYLEAASKAIPASINLGKIILKLGFAIWLGYYILQQVSSIKPVTPGEMLQEILTMGFKVSVAYLAVSSATSVIATYFVNPILELATDYGTVLLNGIQR